MPDLPDGVSGYFEIDNKEGEDREILVVMPITYGPPVHTPAETVRCGTCKQECWKSMRSPSDIEMKCFDCLEKDIPDWRKRVETR